MSWDALKGIREGERQAKASERAKRRGAALARGAGFAKLKSGFSRAAGRAAVARGGRGIIIQKQKNGRGFKGLIDYATDPKKSPQFIFSNCGNDPKSVLRTMCRVVSLRPSISSPVSHITLSLPPQTGKGEERWKSIVAELREQIDVDDSYPCIAVRHSDANHDHVHLIFSRVSVAGQVYDEWGIKLKCAVASEKIEQKFGLKIFPRDMRNQKVTLTKNEVEAGLRKREMPPRLQIALALKVAVQGRPTPAMLVERLSAAGITTKANVSKTTGKMSGFSFSYNGVAFSGSKLSKEYSWQSLERMIDYDQERDRGFLSERDSTEGAVGYDASGVNACIDRVIEDVEQLATAADRGATEPEPPSVGTPNTDRAAPVKTSPAVAKATPTKASTASAKNDMAEVRRSGLGAGHISPPDLRIKRWRRAERLLDEYRRGIKFKAEIADLDRSAVEAGHDPVDIISAHSTVLDKLPAEVAQDVLRNAPSDEMKAYIEREFVASKKRFETQKTDAKHANQPGMRPRM